MIDELISKTDASGTVYYHHDALGSSVALSGETGAVSERYQYDVYGRPAISDAAGNPIPDSAFGNRFLFTGREWIDEIGLYDFRNRVFSAETGRFIQTDPLTFLGGDSNLYRYVRNTPTGLTDPDGLKWGLPTGVIRDALAAASFWLCNLFKCRETCEACCDVAFLVASTIVATEAAEVIVKVCFPLALKSPPLGVLCTAGVSAAAAVVIGTVQEAAQGCRDKCQNKPSSQ